MTNAVKSLGGNALPGANFGYAYDTAGNRTTVKVDSENANYGADALNQVTSRDTLKTRFSGTADASASISVGNATVARQGRYWDALPMGFGSNTQVNVSAILGSQSQSASLWGLQRPASESLGYDLDGNLTSDSAWTYQYRCGKPPCEHDHQRLRLRRAQFIRNDQLRLRLSQPPRAQNGYPQRQRSLRT